MEKDNIKTNIGVNKPVSKEWARKIQKSRDIDFLRDLVRETSAFYAEDPARVSRDGVKGCKYFGNNNTMCAFGRLVHEDCYETLSQLEGVKASGVLCEEIRLKDPALTDIQNRYPQKFLIFMDWLQELHDYTEWKYEGSVKVETDDLLSRTSDLFSKND